MYVLGIGAANVDVHGMSRAAIVMRDSNPGHLRTSAGGVTRNVMENLARLGVEAKMVSVLGDDLFGELVKSESAAAGLDMSESLTLPGVTTSAYVSILDERADMLVAMSDMSVLEHLTPAVVDSKRELIRGAAAVVCDPCLGAETLERILDSAGDTPVFLDPVSTAYARRAAPLAGRFYGLKPNSLELAVLAGMDTDTDEGVERAAASLAGREMRRRQSGRARLLLRRGRRRALLPRAEAGQRDEERHRRGRRLPRRPGLRLREGHEPGRRR